MTATISEVPTQAVGEIHPEQGPFSPFNPSGWASAAFPLGAHIDQQATTFAIYSKHASRVLLEIHAHPMGQEAKFDYWMIKGADNVWRAQLQAVPMGTYYGYRCWGPNWEFTPDWARGNSNAGFLADVDADGNRFNPNKLLFDPYARELSHDRETPEMKETYFQNAAMYGSGPDLYTGEKGQVTPVVRRDFDTGPWAPKGIVIKDASSFGKKPRLKQKDAIIYEAHVKGLSRHPSTAHLTEILNGIPGFEQVADIPDELRGTYAGAGRMAKYLKALGYTTVEFLPVHEFANDLNPEDFPGWDRTLDEPPHGNYWGYMTYGFFAPDLRYSHDKTPGGPTREFKRMVKAFHDEGMEVYLDVVYNHTGEGGLWDGTGDTAELLFLRGYDNAEYYSLSDGNRFYWDSTGCGNNLDAAKPSVQALIKDSLRHWSLEMGVDGFRFDLATVLGRSGANHDFESKGKLLTDIAKLAEQEHIEIIAEAWDLGGYHVGDFPKGWAEWNGRYRDSVRRFLKGDGNSMDFVRSVNGDYQDFQDQGGPQKSVNFITAHDGFTLLDLVSYNQKNNDIAWPFGPSDGGTDDNLSWDSGNDRALRRQRLRNFFTVQILSRGIPMTYGGDELARTQNGNNNPYKIDSLGMWTHYGMIATQAPNEVATGDGGVYHDNYGRDGNPSGKNGLFLFVRYMLAVRRGHECLRQDRFGDFELDKGSDVTFLFKGADGNSDVQDGKASVRLLINGKGIGDSDFLMLINMESSEIDFAVPPARAGLRWLRIVDTAEWAETHGNFWTISEADSIANDYRVHADSVVVLQEA